MVVLIRLSLFGIFPHPKSILTIPTVEQRRRRLSDRPFLSLSLALLDSNVLSKVLEGHTDAVWQLVLADQKLLSASADGSVRLWDPNLSVPLQSTFHSNVVTLSPRCSLEMFV